MGVKCDSQNVVAVPSIQQNVEILTGTHKGKLGLLEETSSQSRLTISTEVLLGTKKKAGWFEIQDGRKLRLKSLAEAKPALVVHNNNLRQLDSEQLENESRSVVADQESLRCQNCQRQFSTVTGRKVHQTRFCKAGLSKNVVVSQSSSNQRRALPVTSVKESSKQSMAEKLVIEILWQT